jgi:hypothetical protein
LCEAQVVTLHDNNSTAMVNVGTQDGMFHWDVQGQNQLQQQWFWFRIGSTAEHSIDTISAPTFSTPNARSLTTTYGNGQFNVRIDYNLSGGAVVAAGQTASADISEAITINNTSAAPLDFHFFQYSAFTLGPPGSDVVQLGKNLHGLFNEADQTSGGSGLTETVVTPGANHGEAAVLGATLAKLNNGLADNLSDAMGPVGPGNVTWALQWDLTIAPGGSAIISKDKNLQVLIVPEPSVVALGALGLVAVIARKRRMAA